MTFFNISALREAIDSPGLVFGTEILRKVENLRVPVCSKSYIRGEVLENEFDPSTVEWQNGATFPGALGRPFDCTIHSIEEISSEPDVRKPKFEVQLAFEKNEPAVRNFEAGDSFYVICPNAEMDVEFILARLNLTSKANLQYKFTVDEDSDKSLPDYIPSLCSIRYVLTYCLDIRRVPGRPVIRALAEYCTDPKERRRLLELCSVDGGKEFQQHVQSASISVIDLLIHFESCSPPIERLVEILPRLLPRAYTVASWDLYAKNRFRFVVSLMKTQAQNGVVYTRFGLCSGYLRSLMNGDQVQLIVKEPSKFRFPLAVKRNIALDQAPIIMIAPGTGIAPFLAFLERFRDLKQMTGAKPNSKRYLFYGSSNFDKEFIFRKEIEKLKEEGVLTDLILCESKPTDSNTPARYVYDGLGDQPKEFFDFLFSSPQPFIYACGDVKQMSRKLWDTLSNLLSQHCNLTKMEAVQYLTEWRKTEYFIEDVWS
ncbi:unnamed protein product [Bursaphelenchus okinawaensis]|uniref:Methionine synthase reductase n=1 Tax=Bursaphelenchus okinawaensis TaxID=465554 RepID=A0A811KBG7_9BILA|nr:unnamed protein product [Bursaphelenchus okinawaensis]CAG9097185.1 unnamed protein product [Bursaphelenchus okinawaensis]